MSVSSQFASSRYNFTIPVDTGYLLYNSATGTVIALSGRDCSRLAGDIGGRPRIIEAALLDPLLVRQLIEGGFLVPEGTDEVASVRARFQNARNTTPAVLTVTTTMDCNLGCYYCYEERSGDRLAISDVPHVLEVARQLLGGNKESLHVDWYGGEPLMNLEFLEAASFALQDLCKESAVFYSASIISNGTSWPKDIKDFVRKHKIRQVQLSFDGLRDNHNKRRRYRKQQEEGARSSFDKVVELVDELVQHTRIDLRFNLDRGNQRDVIPFMRFARRKGWFDGPHRVVFQPARLASYSDRSQFMRKVELSIDDYEAIRASIRDHAAGSVCIEEAEVPDRFPYPRSSVCAALAKRSVVVGADANLYRCGLQVGEHGRSVGQMKNESSDLLPILNGSNGAGQSDAQWWAQFDPTLLSSCSRCSFLPVCWGGCPKKHLEQDRHALAEQGSYWRQNLPRLVAEGVGKSCDSNFVFSQMDQFRDPSQTTEI